MKSHVPGNGLSRPEIYDLSKEGFRLRLDATEYFLDFTRFPWFKEASTEQIENVQLFNKTHLFWPDLDIDLNWKILKDPERFVHVYHQKLSR